MRAVFLDIGETLIDETRVWTGEAERAGISPLVFFAALGALIERGADQRQIWELAATSRSISISSRLRGGGTPTTGAGAALRIEADQCLVATYRARSPPRGSDG